MEESMEEMVRLSLRTLKRGGLPAGERAESVNLVLRDIGGQPMVQNRNLELDLQPAPGVELFHPDTNERVKFPGRASKPEDIDVRLLEAYENECAERRANDEALSKAQLINLACALGWMGRYHEALEELDSAARLPPAPDLDKLIADNRDTLKKANKHQVLMPFDPFKVLRVELFAEFRKKLVEALGSGVDLRVDPSDRMR